MQIPLTKSSSITLIVLLLFSTLCIRAQDKNFHHDPRVDFFLSLKTNMQKNLLLGDNYTAQIYSGNLNVAKKIRAKSYGLFPQWRVIINYETPNYKVWVGNFSSRLIADRALRNIQTEFPAAFIFKPVLKRKKKKRSTN